MRCWACGQQARGFRHLDLTRAPADPRRYPHRWAFCSRRCQDAFHQLYDSRRRHEPASLEELAPVTLPLSPDAQRACLRALGNAADAVGFAVPLAQYSQTQALRVIDAVIHAYERQQHQQSRAVRGLPPLDDFEDDDIPF
jgi:hypothetical protein